MAVDRRKKQVEEPRNRRSRPRMTEDFMRIVDRVLDGPPGTITHIAEQEDGGYKVVPDPSKPTVH